VPVSKSRAGVNADQGRTEDRELVEELAKREGKGRGSSRRSRRNSDRFILDVGTHVGSLTQDSNSDSAKANYANRQPPFPDGGSLTSTKTAVKSIETTGCKGLIRPCKIRQWRTPTL
jgi:hypothetical protein